jgi:hypothetical protein
MAELRADWRKDHPRPDGQFWDSAAGVKSALANDVKVHAPCPSSKPYLPHRQPVFLQMQQTKTYTDKGLNTASTRSEGGGNSQ